jgi:hypothetical protein
MTLIDYFIAKDDAEAAQVGTGTSGPELYGFDTLYAKGIDPCVALGTLESSLLTVPSTKSVLTRATVIS